MTAAADYCFNKSHAACYALIAYRTAYLKANYPAEYMAAVISSVMSTKDKVPFFVNRCEEMGIEVLPPDVNSSDHGFVVSRQVDPLRARRGQERRPRRGRGDPRGAGARRPVRLDLGLLRAGRRPRRQQAGDRVPGQVRRARLDRGDAAGDARGPRPGAGGRRRSPRRTPRAVRPRSSTSATAGRAPSSAPRARGPPPADPGRASSTSASCCALEKETLGTFLSAHPLAEVREALRDRVDCSLAELAEKAGRRLGHGRRDRQRGQEDPHRSGADVMFATLDDLEGGRDVRPRRRGRGRARRSSSTAVIAGPRAGRPQGPRRDEPGRRRGRAVRAAEDEVAAARAKARARASPSRSCCGSTPPLRRRACRGAEVGVRRLPRRERGAARDGDPRGNAPAAVRLATTGSTPSPALRAEIDQLLGGRAMRWRALDRAPADLDFRAWRFSSTARGSAPRRRVPAVPHLLRQADRAARLPRDALPVPLQLRRRAVRRPLHGLHAEGLRRRDRRRHVRGRRAQRRLRRHQDDRRAAAAVPVPRRARATRATARPTDCVNPRFFDCTDDGPEAIRAFDLRDALA